jgi:hypothetical protein
MFSKESFLVGAFLSSDPLLNRCFRRNATAQYTRMDHLQLPQGKGFIFVLWQSIG